MAIVSILRSVLLGLVLMLTLLAGCGDSCPGPPGDGEWPRRISADGVDYGTCDPCGPYATVVLDPEPCADLWGEESTTGRSYR
jgi:hypothetical protein